MKKTVLLTSLLLALNATAQQGDKEGESQPMLVPKELIPPAPVLTPAEALETFEIKPGFRIEIAAAEPLLETPVAMEFDADGRMWVVEMIGYMLDADGTGEDQPSGRIVVLEDTDNDGRMDKRTVFLDELVMPRAIGLAYGGVLVAEMPNLWFCRDTDGDLVSDEKTLVADDYIQGDIKNPEHNPNGLLWAMDNWIYSANYTTRFRLVDGVWKRESTPFRGQWGLAQDDEGRLVYNTNSDQLRVDLIPGDYLERNPHFNAGAGRNWRPVPDQSTFPIRVNPGINRGYQPHMLKDGKLSRFTGASGSMIYRGDQFPEEFKGNAFVPEPTGNLVKRNILRDEDGVVRGEFAYPDSEFLASTDERFRPVNLYNGPDGALYLVDMYRGLIQHRIYLTSYLRKQVEERGLEQPTDHGRIYRIVHEGNPRKTPPKLSEAEDIDLVRHLRHDNGWVRDTAQRLLIERDARQQIPVLREIVSSTSDTLPRIHALWVLEGLGAADARTVAAALRSDDPVVQTQALRVADAVPEVRSALSEQISALTSAESFKVAWMAALVTGNLEGDRELSGLRNAAFKQGDNAFMRDAIVSGLKDREAQFLNQLLADLHLNEEQAALVKDLSSAVYRSKNAEAIGALLSLAAEKVAGAEWITRAVLGGIDDALPRARRGQPEPRIRAVQLPAEPAGFAGLLNSSNDGIKELAASAARGVNWSADAPDSGPTELTAEQQALFDQGKELYSITCGACHQINGRGMDGLAPSLIGSEWVNGDPERLARIVLHGLSGPIVVDDKEWNLIMPGLGTVFSDEQVAAVMTYVRRNWEHSADPVNPALVEKVRAEDPDRVELWTVEELKKLE